MSARSRPAILLTRRWPLSVETDLKTRYDLTVDSHDTPLSKAQLREAMHHFDAICPTVSDKLDADVLLEPNPRVKIIANYGAGFEHIDLNVAKQVGIPVTNTPDVLTKSTAELALLLILMTSRRASEGERELRDGLWSGWRPTHLLGKSLEGKCLGLVGYGRIAQATAALAKGALGMNVSYFSRKPAETDEVGSTYIDSLDRLLATADVVSLHCPGGSETHHLINARRLSLMRTTAIIINTARGSVINETDLAYALANGVIAAAGLDVYESEPNVTPALRGLNNVVLLPHLGSATLETRVAMGNRVVANLDRFFAGQALPDQVA